MHDEKEMPKMSMKKEIFAGKIRSTADGEKHQLQSSFVPENRQKPPYAQKKPLLYLL